ncbi:NUDIX hydrolase [Pseudonocardia asaccharolytica]|uniref:NUDIX hydrolase n=1 Tax=Pseudonocardia asaccharolytica DSM 44247 = NBRC 16224 TaxID=1123024 RepID=A0A511D0J3_9PSEU|nr:NUDIX domain-containing protein [Pseudonocardia asaccharolytica]GEL18217.1 NUDIX hydrolase [Pseudonocardia asaccharolytica DSM 44247 = NBRC 16224]
MRGNLFAVAVDLVVLTVRDGALCGLLVQRAAPPYAGYWALPGGFVRPREDLRDTAARQLAELTRAATGDAVTGHLEQLASYATPDRDPRGRVLSVAHLALLPDLPEPVADPEAAVSAWRPIDETAGLAFDHDRILADGVERARAKLEYSTLAASFCPSEFTISELRRVYEAVWQTEIDPRNFSRKVTSTDGFLMPTESRAAGGRGRPAQLFRRGPATALSPPLTRLL